MDTKHKNNEMLVILKNVMNDLYARDTSNKIKAVKQSTFKGGKYVRCYAPLGYKKSADDKNTHEPIISQETWDAVQRMDNHPSRSRTGKSGAIALFGGLLRCMDCGSSFRFVRDYRTKRKASEYKTYAEVIGYKKKNLERELQRES